MPPPAAPLSYETTDLETMSLDQMEQLAVEMGVDINSIKREGGTHRAPQYGQEEGQGFWNRMQAGFKSTPREKFDFYKSVLGDDQVSLAQDGSILWSHPEKGWQTVDEQGVEWGDVADLAGDVPELLGMVLSSRLPGGNFLKGVMGAGGGNIVKQGIEQVLPGQSEASAGELGGAALLGGVSEKVGHGLSALGFRGNEVVREKVLKALTRGMDRGEGLGSAFAKESSRLAGKFDIPLTASQITQGPFEKTLAGYAARSPFGISAFEKHEVLAQKKAHEAANRFLQQLHPERLTEEGLGSKVRVALDRTKAQLENQLYRDMEKDFAFLARATGERPVIPAENFRSFLESQAMYYLADTMPAAARKIGHEMQKMAAEIPEGMMSARALEERLKRLGAASYGREPLFDSLKDVDKAGQTRLAKEAYQALLRDLDSAVEGSTAKQLQQGPVSRLLKQARDNVSRNAGAVEEFSKNSLARFGFSDATQAKGVEKLAKWFSAAPREPSEVRNAMEILSFADPDLPNRMAAYIFEQAIEAGRRGGAGEAAAFSRKEMAKHLPRPEIMAALFPNDPRGAGIASDVADLNELIARSLWQGGQRPVLQESPYKTAGSVVSQGTFFGTVRSLMERVLTPKMVARFETDPQAREAIYSMVRRLEKGEKLTRAMESQLERLAGKGAALGIYETGSLAAGADKDKVR